MQTRLRIGTRGSALALAQTHAFIAALAKAHGWSDPKAQTEIVVIKTTGDKIQDRSLADLGGKGLFAKEIEDALIGHTIDCAVHSLKDMPEALPPGLIIAGHLPREDPRDALISLKAASLAELPQGAVIGSSSVRRQAMLLNKRPDLKMVLFRGNVDTRLRKVAEGQVDATILAIAGLKRLGLDGNARHVFSVEEMLPAAAQGAIGIELRTDDSRTRALVEAIDHRETALTVAVERAFLATLDGSCRTPIGALAERNGTSIKFTGCVLSLDGKIRHDVARNTAIANVAEAAALGRDAGQDLLARAGRSLFTV